MAGICRDAFKDIARLERLINRIGFMQPRWTILDWDGLACKFIPKARDVLPKLQSRQRIPQIDKILHKPVDPRPTEFHELLKRSVSESGARLESWVAELSVNELEQYSLAIAQSGEGIRSIPKRVFEKLTSYGLKDELKRQLDLMGNAKVISTRAVNHPDHADTLAVLSSGLEAEDVQQTLERLRFIDPRVQPYRKLWAESLAEHGEKKLKRSSSKEEFKALNQFLPVAEQAQIVADELCLFTSEALAVTFPASLSTVCRKLGESLEHSLLLNARKQITQLDLPYIHRRSEYVWGLAGHSPWTVRTRMILGAWWIQSALEACRFTQVYQGRQLNRPAFWNTWFIKRPTKRGVIVVNEYLLKMLKATELATPSISADEVPSLVVPRPWTSIHATNVPRGSVNLSLVVSPSTEGQATIKESIDNEAALKQLEGLNRLQSQSWRINQSILGILQKDEPEDALGAISGKAGDREEKSRQIQWKKAMSIAAGLGSRQFYLPMYMDFRGRCYASSRSGLNFMGNDAMRAMFLFAEAKKLGKEGLCWLELHLANLYGHCKSSSFHVRRSWVEKNKKQIVASAKWPLDYDWWRQSRKPYQTLAACFELYNAWSCSNPSSYETALPIQIDGTSNGLQHLVALARDETHSAAVNLTRMHDDSCGDVYSSVASSLGLDVKRDVIKQAVMTFFYGASTARMASIFAKNGPDFTSDEAKSITSRLGGLFEKERAIQDWLVDCARRIMNARRADRSHRGAALVWTSPLGLPVVQPYVEPKLMAVRTPLQSFFLPSPFHLPQVVGQKQTVAAVANFVHCLDAAHMLSTASSMPPDCDFSAVHDCFWTHPSSVAVLNSTLRQTFVKMHSRDLLSDLRVEWLERYKHFKVLGTVHSDSPLYEKLLWERGGATGGAKENASLERELVELYAGKDPYAFAAKSGRKHEVVWEGAKPRVGSRQHPHIKMWFPLELASAPARGKLNLGEVLDSPYFFN